MQRGVIERATSSASGIDVRPATPVLEQGASMRTRSNGAPETRAAVWPDSVNTLTLVNPIFFTRAARRASRTSMAAVIKRWERQESIMPRPGVHRSRMRGAEMTPC